MPESEEDIARGTNKSKLARNRAAHTARDATAPTLERARRHHNAGDLHTAEALYREVLCAEPKQHAALFLLGLIEHQRQAHDAACGWFEQAVSCDGTNARYRYFLGLELQAQKRHEAALIQLTRARELDPSLLDAWLSEGALRLARGELDLAQHAFSTASSLQPLAALPHEHLGEVELARGRLDAACAHFERAAELDLTFAEPVINLGVICQRRNQLERARTLFQTACQRKPASGFAHFNLGWVEQKLGLLDAAGKHFRQALLLEPTLTDALVDLAGVLHELGELDEALACYRAALVRAPHPAHHSSMISLMLYDPRITLDAVLVEARAWAQRYAPAAAEYKYDLEALASAPRLRIGYVSPDFRAHAVSSFFEPLLAAHDRSRFEVVCYSNVKSPDEVTARMAEHARFESIRDRGDAEVAEQIRSDGIHILIDLAGHTVDHRLALFGLAPAPVQATYLGYPGTTGVAAIRYRFSDAIADPSSTTDASYSEQLVRLDGGFCCFRPPDRAPAVSDLPCLSRGYVTFGSLNNYTKLSAAVFEAWTVLLTQLPNARLLLQSRPLGDPAIRERVWSRFAALGVARDRIELHGATSFDAHLALYREIDIALDAFPWNGHTTTCLALHMGVPVVVVAGDRFASRMGATVLSRVGLQDWIATDTEGYIALAAHHAQDVPQLSRLRQGLRAQLASSPLCDAVRFTRNLETTYETLWRERLVAG